MWPCEWMKRVEKLSDNEEETRREGRQSGSRRGDKEHLCPPQEQRRANV